MSPRVDSPTVRPSAPAPRPSANTAPSLDAAARGEGLVRRGQSGESVRQLQEELRARGIPVTVDGRFGPETERAVRQFQQQQGIKVDGLVGPETMGKLRLDCHGSSDAYNSTPARPSNAPGPRAPTADELRAPPPSGTVRAGDLARADQSRRANNTAASDPAPTGGVRATLAPEGASERERYDHYAAIVRANGGQVCPNGQPTVLGIRGLSRDGQAHDTTSARRYDDTMVVLTPDGRVRELRGATHPGQNNSTASPDVTGDGVGDVGMIKPGNYQVVPNGPHGGNASYHVRTMEGSGSLPGWRDTNHDGRFSDGERAASDQRGDRLTGVLFHPGGSTAPSSIGCQTMDPQTYQQFVDAIGGPRARFNYTLVDANR
jgi:peptidoglycan hydrolase-like protein with peptidoglycan-binding domain